MISRPLDSCRPSWVKRAVTLAPPGALMALLVGCATTHHTVDPYRFDPQEAVRLGFRADRICREARGLEEAPPERAFVTDGCSMWPDDPRYVECCVEHDILYWCGGTAAQRLAADDAFGVCVASRTSPGLGGFVRAGTRAGGHPVFPAPWRWGYGDGYRGRYPAPSSQSEVGGGSEPRVNECDRTSCP